MSMVAGCLPAVDLGALGSGLAALVGVALGGWLTSRSQRRLLELEHRREQRRSREEAYVALLAAYRRFRVFVLTQAEGVDVVGGPPGVPLVRDAGEYSDAVQDATARVQLLSGSADVLSASRALSRAFRDVARARATHPRGAVPDLLIDAARQAELHFAEAARSDLSRV